MFERRSIATCIVLSIFTLGIYGIYWQYRMLKDLYTLSGKPDNSGTDILLSIVTLGIYGIYLYYKMGKLVNDSRLNMGLSFKDNSVIYLVSMLITYFLGFSYIVHFVIFGAIQDDLNNNIVPAYASWQYSYVVDTSSVPPLGTPYFDDRY